MKKIFYASISRDVTVHANDESEALYEIRKIYQNFGENLEVEIFDEEKQMTNKTGYEYIVTEQTLDIRNYTVKSDVQLSESEIYEVFYQVDYVDGSTNNFEINGKKGTVTFNGTDFGDDGQLDIEGDERIDE